MSFRRILGPVAALALLTSVGTLGMIALEGMSFSDALYFAVVTLSTVGYGDFAPHTRSGQLFVAALIAAGVGFVLYLLSVIAAEVMGGRLLGDYQREHRAKQIDKLEGHVVVCGYGRFGEVIVDELREGGRSIVVIESDPERAPMLEKSGVSYILGDATQDEALVAAGIERADALVVATSSAADAVFITLSAKELNPNITVHARVESEAAVRRMRHAGAEHVVSPYQMGGVRLAASVLNRSVVDFLELSLPQRHGALGMEEVRVGDGSPVVGRAVREIEEAHPHLRIVARKRVGRSVELVLEQAEQVTAGDYLVVIGESEPLKQLAREAVGD